MPISIYNLNIMADIIYTKHKIYAKKKQHLSSHLTAKVETLQQVEMFFELVSTKILPVCQSVFII